MSLALNFVTFRFLPLLFAPALECASESCRRSIEGLIFNGSLWFRARGLGLPAFSAPSNNYCMVIDIC